MSAADRQKVPTTKDYFIDTGLDKKSLEKLVGVGDTITRERKLIEMGDCINCKSLDNRVSVFILIEMLKKIKKTPPYDIYAVFTVQEEIGIRGANVSSLQINPDFGFGLDTTIAWDTPGSTKQEQVSALGEGACIKVMDSSTVCDYRMVAYMKKIAKTHKIKTETLLSRDLQFMQSPISINFLSLVIVSPTPTSFSKLFLSKPVSIK